MSEGKREGNEGSCKRKGEKEGYMEGMECESEGRRMRGDEEYM